MYLTHNMQNALRQICGGLKHVDVRSGAALARRGLARYEPYNANSGHYFATYHPTEKGLVRAYQLEKKEWYSAEQCKILTDFAVWLAERKA